MLLLATCILLITLVLLEITVRLWGHAERHIYDPIFTSFDRTRDIPYVHKPNLTNARARGLAIINTDSLGLRAITAGTRYGPKQENEYRIAIVGDSMTFGEGIPRTEDTFPQVLEDRLNQKQHVHKAKVFNYGVSAYSVKQMAATLQYRMLDIQPDFVVVAVIPQDFDLGRTPMVDASGYLIDRWLASVNPPDSLIRRLVRNIRLIYPFRDIVYSWFNTHRDIVDSLANGELPESYPYVQQFKETADGHHLPYLILLLPPGRTGLFDRISKELRRDQMTFLDLSPLRNEFTPEQFRASQFDGHLSAAVHHRIGETLAEYILSKHMKT